MGINFIEAFGLVNQSVLLIKKNVDTVIQFCQAFEKARVHWQKAIEISKECQRYYEEKCNKVEIKEDFDKKIIEKKELINQISIEKILEGIVINNEMKRNRIKNGLICKRIELEWEYRYHPLEEKEKLVKTGLEEYIKSFKEENNNG
jgi:hypothetical protein